MDSSTPSQWSKVNRPRVRNQHEQVDSLAKQGSVRACRATATLEMNCASAHWCSGHILLVADMKFASILASLPLLVGAGGG